MTVKVLVTVLDTYSIILCRQPHIINIPVHQGVPQIYVHNCTFVVSGIDSSKRKKRSPSCVITSWVSGLPSNKYAVALLFRQFAVYPTFSLCVCVCP